MTARQVTATPRRLSLPFVVAVVAVAFLLGALAGLGLPSVLGVASRQADVARSAIAVVHTPDVAQNNMSDAAYAARFGSVVHTPDVAQNNMSDAAYAARFGSVVHTPDVAQNNMSDAAYAARFGSALWPHSLTRAQWEALYGPAAGTWGVWAVRRQSQSGRTSAAPVGSGATTSK